MSRIGRAAVGLAMAAAGVAVPAEAATAAEATEGPACAVRYEQYPYSGGLTANIVVENTGTVTILGWTFLFPVDEGVEITEFWNAELVSPTGVVSARDQETNAVLEPGETVSFGFRARGSQSGIPASFTVNTVTCTLAT